VGLGGYIYFVTWKKPEADTGTKQEKVFAGVQSDKIDELTITSGKGEKTTLKKDGSAWQVTSPISAKADESEVSGITSNLSSVEVTRVIDDKPANLKEYGLETPRVEVDFKAAGDKEPRRLFLGDKSPTGSSVYAKRNAENRVFLIPAFQDTAFDKSSFDLRDKTLVKFDRDKVDGIELTADGKTTALTKDGSDWKLTKPLQTKADFGSVEGLIGRMQSAQMKSIVTAEPTPADLKKYGLDKPSETVTLDLGSARAVVELGGKA